MKQKAKIIQNSKFIVNGTTVICIINARIYDCGFADPGIITVKGIARCHESDTFDEAVGRKIAESKACTKLYTKINKMFNDYLSFYTEYVDNIKYNIDRINKMNETELSHYNILIS